MEGLALSIEIEILEITETTVWIRVYSVEFGKKISYSDLELSKGEGYIAYCRGLAA